MSRLNLARLMTTERDAPRNGEPAIGLVRVPNSNRGGGPQFDGGTNHPFHAGIGTLYGQLCSCQSSDGKPIRSFGFTSCYPREGTSTIVEYLGSIAAESRNVLLIDANESESEILRALQDIARKGAAHTNGAALTNGSHQHAIKTGSLVKAAAVPTIEETRHLFRSLSAKFDWILVDLPPLNSAEVLRWAPLIGGIVLVVESERVRWQVAARGIATLEQAGSHVLGTVMNKQREYIPEWLYQLL